MATPTEFEQLTLELINQARLNPHGEFERWVTNAPANVQNALNFFNVNLTVLKQQFDALNPVAPVAWNLALGDSAQTHSDLMVVHDQQSHFLPGEPSISQRMINAGYANLTQAWENIFAFAQDAGHAHAGFFIDWGNGPNGIQDPAGHRNTIMNGSLTEVGIGHAIDNNPNTNVGPNLVTHHFATRSNYTAQISGVVFNDADNDRFYDIGEGVGGTTISAAGGSTANWSSGGYNLALAAGAHMLTFSGALGTAAIKVNLGAENIKVDMFDPGSFRSSVSATLKTGAALELLGEKSINATGNKGANLLIGNNANNILNGKAGADRMIGLDGNDTYIVDNKGDVVIEAANGGIDTVKSSISYTLTANVERLVLTGSADINGAGNALANRLTGNDSDNMLNGKGGADRMTGLGGNDTYIVDNTGDVVVEAANGGTDTVRSSITYTLRANIEHLVLTGSSDINGAGNALANELTGNATNNVLNGRAGADRMTGLGGNDTYIVDNAGDVVIEAANGGTDTVKSSISYTLTANVERLMLTGSADINGTGNALNNRLIGNSDDNILNGGRGNDILTGGGGSDFFRFNTALGANNVDTITDFQVNVDKIQLENAIFTAVGAGMTVDEFVANATGVATNGEQHILYNTTNGRLFYDADGNGAQARVHFATLTAGLALDHLDFLVI